jgi:hypothetical protein
MYYTMIFTMKALAGFKIPATLRFALATVLLSPFLPFSLAGQIRTIYVVPSSHWDRGFLTSPNELAPRLKPHLDQVIDDAAADPDFRWTVESVWQLNSWLARTHDSKRLLVLRHLIKNGQIEISASYGSMHTSFMGPEELDLWTQDSFRMSRALGINRPELAMMDDVPGFVRWLPQVLASSGVRYFLNGSNLFIGGGTSLAPGHVPFYWQAPDGSRVLTWISEGKQGGYTEGLVDYYLAPEARDPYPPHGLLIPRELAGKPPLNVMRLGIRKLLERYEKAGYKYDAVLVMFMHDAISPAVEKDDLLPMVREWNASGQMPQIRVAIPKEFFDHITAEYGPKIPTYRGDWTGLWAEVKTNSPGISAIARRDQMDLRANGLLWGALRLQRASALPSGNFLGDYRRLWNYDEHSGAGQTGWPGIMTVRETNDQNREYVDYVRDAENDQTFLLSAGIHKEAEFLCGPASMAGSPSVSPALAVYRPQSWAATSVITIPQFDGFEHVGAFKSMSSGTMFLVQWNGRDGYMTAPLPATGIELFEPIRTSRMESAAAQTTRDVTLQNRYYRIELGPADGSIVQLIDRDSGHEIVNTAAHDSFNKLVRVVESKRVTAMEGTIKFRVFHGPIFDSIEARRPGSYEPATEYRLYHAIKRLEIRNLLDLSRMPVVTNASTANTYQFIFPLLPGNQIQSFQYESGFGMTKFPQDYLPGARMDAVVSHGLVFSAGRFRVAMASPQAFYWDVPSLSRRPWRLWQNEILSAVLRRDNLGETRDYGQYIFSTVEPGLPERLWVVYDLTSWTGPWSDGEAYRKIWDTVMEPVSEIEPSLPTSCARTASNSLFQTNQPDVVVIAAGSSLPHQGSIVLRLQNLSGNPHRTIVTLPATGFNASLVNLAETNIRGGKLPVYENHVEVQVGGHATVSILLSPAAH